MYKNTDHDDPTKSYVGMGYSVCPVCCCKHNEVVLLDNRMRNTLERNNCMGWELCKEHTDMSTEYVALVEVTNTEQPTLKNAIRTGNYGHVRRSVFPEIFNSTVEDTLPFVFVQNGVLDLLQKIPQATTEEVTD